MNINKVILVKLSDIKPVLKIQPGAEVIIIDNVNTVTFRNEHEYFGFPMDPPRWGGMNAVEKNVKYVAFIGDGEKYSVLGSGKGMLFGNQQFSGKFKGFILYQEYGMADKKPPFIIDAKKLKLPE